MATTIHWELMRERGAALIPLRRKIERVIAPWAASEDTETAPPFTTDELVIFALIFAPCEVPTKSIVSFLARNFSYYKSFATKANDILCHRIKRSLKLVENPFAMPSKTDDVPWSDAEATISALDAERSLTSMFASVQEEDAVSFFDMSPEVRNWIYEYAFTYPPCGLELQYKKNNKKFGLAKEFAMKSRSFTDDYDWERWDSRSKSRYQHALFTRPISQILAPLLTCRQFYREATPFFYHCNHFHAPRYEGLGLFLKSLVPARRNQLTFISLNGERHAEKPFVEVLETLCTLPSLKKLNIHLNETVYSASRQGIFDLLCSLQRKCDLRLFGGCASIRRALAEDKDKQAVEYRTRKEADRALWDKALKELRANKALDDDDES